MQTITPIMAAISQLPKNCTPAEINKHIMPLCTAYCMGHPDCEQLILIVQIRDLKPLLYSWSYNFSIVNVHEKVQNALKLAKKGRSEDITVLEWFCLKGVKIPYYGIFA